MVRSLLLIIALVGLSRADPCDRPLSCNATLHLVAACVYGCPPERTCQNRNWPPLPCANPGFPCTEKCICDEGYARNKDDGTCVTLEQCDKCPGDNEYFECDGAYDEHCAGHCYCYSGYTRDIADKCVYVDPAAPPQVLEPPADTTETVVTVTTEANQGEALNCNASLHETPGCLFPCPPQRTCQNFRGPEPPCAPPREPCKRQCVCANGYARNKYGGTCVTFAQCDKCPGYSQYFACDGDYSDNCEGSCHCADGYERDSNNTCVSTYSPPPVVYNPPPPPTGVIPTVLAQPPQTTDTPPDTTETVVTTEANQGELNCNASLHETPGCLYPCPPQRTCQNFRGPIPPCLPPREPCKRQCVCANGYARNKYGGTCVTFAQCDKCPGYSQYFACDGDYSDNCEGSCHCADGYERDSNNTCVSTYSPPPVVYDPPPPPTGVIPTVLVQPPRTTETPEPQCGKPPRTAIFYNL